MKMILDRDDLWKSMEDFKSLHLWKVKNSIDKRLIKGILNELSLITFYYFVVMILGFWGFGVWGSSFGLTIGCLYIGPV